MRRHLASVVLAATLVAPCFPVNALWGQELDSELLSAFRWRQIGPANMSGRVTDVEGIPSPSKTFYVAAAAGGIWKTTNNGTTFRPLFTDERVISLGDIAIAPSDTMQIWAGHRGGGLPELHLPRRWNLQVHGRRADVGAQGPGRDADHRPDRRPPHQPESGLGGGAWAHLGFEPGAGHLPDR